MKQEDIEKAADEFANKEYEISDIDRIPLYKGFYHGAEWHINSVWHKVEDIPQHNAWFLAQIGNDCFDTFEMHIGSYLWKRWCKVNNIVRWAYIEDLLPNTEGLIYESNND